MPILDGGAPDSLARCEGAGPRVLADGVVQDAPQHAEARGQAWVRQTLTRVFGYTKIIDSMSLTKTRDPRWLCLSIACVALLSVAWPFAARAGAKESKERAAKTACLAGDYAKGVALLAELYVSTNDINHLFNQGRCFEQNGRYEEAITRFREYQQKNADIGNPPDVDADRHIQKCQSILDKQKPASTLAPTAAATPVPSASTPTKSEAEVKPAPVEASPTAEPKMAIVESASPSSRGRSLRITGITTAAVGVVGVATGVILNLKANSLAKDLEAANGSATTLYSRSTESSRSTYRTFGWVAYGAGAACLAGGAVMYFVGLSQKNEAQLTFMPALVADRVGAVLEGAF
jgi:tetratricopeptide (TPR) repeat protein